MASRKVLIESILRICGSYKPPIYLDDINVGLTFEELRSVISAMIGLKILDPMSVSLGQKYYHVNQTELYRSIKCDREGITPLKLHLENNKLKREIKRLKSVIEGCKQYENKLVDEIDKLKAEIVSLKIDGSDKIEISGKNRNRTKPLNFNRKMKVDNAKEEKGFDVQEYINARHREHKKESNPVVLPDSMFYCETFSARLSPKTCVKRWLLAQKETKGWSSNVNESTSVYKRCVSCSIGKSYANTEGKK